MSEYFMFAWFSLLIMRFWVWKIYDLRWESQSFSFIKFLSFEIVSVSWNSWLKFALTWQPTSQSRAKWPLLGCPLRHFYLGISYKISFEYNLGSPVSSKSPPGKIYKLHRKRNTQNLERPFFGQLGHTIWLRV